MGWSCLRFLGLPALSFSASSPPLLSWALSVSSRPCCFCLSSWPLRGSVPLLLAPRPGCWVSLSPPVPSFSLPQPVVRSATSSGPLSRPFGFCFCGSFCSSLVASAASVEVSSDPLVRVPPSFPGSVCPASLLLCLFAVCALLQASGFSQSPLRLSFLIRISSSGSILEFSLPSLAYPVFCCSCGFAGFCLSCPPLFAGLVRPTSASLSLLLGFLFHGPALVGSSSRALSGSLSTARWLLVPVWGFLQLPALLLLPLRCFILHCS